MANQGEQRTTKRAEEGDIRTMTFQIADVTKLGVGRPHNQQGANDCPRR